MFTGIIETTSVILARDQGRFTLKNPFVWELQLGQSIAHDGACMTVESFCDESYTIFMMEESLKKTHFHEKNVWDIINIERCLQLNDRIDGHFVSGHIDGTGTCVWLKKNADNSLIISIEYPEYFQNLTIEKWSIAVNGVSLTIAKKENNRVEICLIPLTQSWTNLGALKVWSLVNIEFDMLGKYILQK